jgi:hypothetical protein
MEVVVVVLCLFNGIGMIGVSQFYFKKENASTKSEYEKAKQRCLNFLNQ